MRRLPALVVCLLLALCAGGCGSKDSPSSSSSSSSSAVQPEFATDWMKAATQYWRDRGSGTTIVGAFPKVIQGGKVWTGDPRRYEKACGVTFLIDGDTPQLYGGIHGEDPSANPKPTYYRWLQSDPKRWSAFNAWLYDPAIVKQLGRTGYYGKTRADRIGTTKDCPDAEQAGTPVS